LSSHCLEVAVTFIFEVVFIIAFIKSIKVSTMTCEGYTMLLLLTNSFKTALKVKVTTKTKVKTEPWQIRSHHAIADLVDALISQRSRSHQVKVAAEWQCDTKNLFSSGKRQILDDPNGKPDYQCAKVRVKGEGHTGHHTMLICTSSMRTTPS
jgi:hypothetical protein